jgi:hypothetical protein
MEIKRGRKILLTWMACAFGDRFIFVGLKFITDRQQGAMHMSHSPILGCDHPCLRLGLALGVPSPRHVPRRATCSTVQLQARSVTLSKPSNMPGPFSSPNSSLNFTI